MKRTSILLLLCCLSLSAFAKVAAAEPAANVQLRPSNLARTITPVTGGKYRVAITFTAGAHANDRIITSLFYMVKSSTGALLASGEGRFKDLCVGSACSFTSVYLANSAAEAQQLTLYVGHFSPVQVRWIANSASTATCEFESCEYCPASCGVCSCAGIIARPGTIGTEVSTVLSWANQEHYHTGYALRVP